MEKEYQACIQIRLKNLEKRDLGMPIVNYLHTIVVSGYWKADQWQSWADKLILSGDELKSWVYDVAFAKNKEELCLAIAYEKTIEVFEKETLYCESDVVIGYYYLLYQEGRMALSELFSKLCDEDDISSEAELLSSQEIMGMLDKMQAGKADIKKLNELLMPLAKIAKKQLEALLYYI